MHYTFTISGKNVNAVPVGCNLDLGNLWVIDGSDGIHVHTSQDAVNEGCALCRNAFDMAHIEQDAVWRIKQPAFWTYSHTQMASWDGLCKVFGQCPAPVQLLDDYLPVFDAHRYD